MTVDTSGRNPSMPVVRRPTWQLAFALLVAAVFVGVLAGFASGRIKLLLLFWTAVGSGLGAAVTVMSRSLEGSPRGRLAVFSAVLTTIAVVTGTGADYTRWKSALDKEYQADNAALKMQLTMTLGEMSSADTLPGTDAAKEFRDELFAEREQIHTTNTAVDAYLHNRLSGSPLRDVSRRMAIFLWILETGVASTASFLVVWFGARPSAGDDERAGTPSVSTASE